jgi:hypothetical protein
LTLRAVFRLALRQTEGLIGSILQLLGLDLAVPDHSTLSRRAETLEVPRPCQSAREPVHLLVDSTGLRLCGPGEWLIEKHGTRRRRSWRKLHIGVDAGTGQILAAEVTDCDVDDGSQVEPLLDQITAPLASFIGDGAYDQAGIYDTIAKRDPDADVIVPPRSTAVLTEAAESAPTQRDRHLQSIAEHGRVGWQKRSGYTRRADPPSHWWTPLLSSCGSWKVFDDEDETRFYPRVQTRGCCTFGEQRSTSHADRNRAGDFSLHAAQLAGGCEWWSTSIQGW